MTKGRKNGQIKNMKTKAPIIRRVVLIALGLQTIAASTMGIYGGVAQLRAWQGDPLSGASIVALLLGILLAIGGGWLVLRGIKFQDHAA